MLARHAMAVALAAAALASACGESPAPPFTAGGLPPASPDAGAPGGAVAVDASCSPVGTSLQISAQSMAFDTTCLAAPAGRALTIHFENREAVPHNLSIFTADPMQDRSARVLFRGEVIVGPRSVDYAVGALPAGVYHFHCDLHPTQMSGAFVVK
jgi:plastocyanin